MGKGEIARYEQFLLFPQCFQKACFPEASKGVSVLEWVKNIYFTWIEKQVLTTYTNLSRFCFLGTTPVLAPNVWANEKSQSWDPLPGLELGTSWLQGRRSTSQPRIPQFHQWLRFNVSYTGAVNYKSRGKSKHWQKEKLPVARNMYMYFPIFNSTGEGQRVYVMAWFPLCIYVCVHPSVH